MKLAIIPARGGSKRIPRKNIRPFAGRPIIAYAIQAAQEAALFDRIVVSTDDEEIAAVARSYGAESPFVRPAELADDHATTMDVVRHGVEWASSQGVNVDMVCCIYATAPLVRAADIRAAAEVLTQSGADYCLPVTSFPFPIQRAVRITPSGRLRMFQPEHMNTRSQDLEEAYHDAGLFFWARANAVMEKKPVFGGGTMPFDIPRYRVQDIDTLEDWKRAELLFDLLAQSAAGGQDPLTCPTTAVSESPANNQVHQSRILDKKT